MSGSGAAADDEGEFVEGWLVARVLGEGAYGEVRLLVHGATGARVALKAVAGGEGGQAGQSREAALWGALRHPHVVRCLGARAAPPLHYLFLEWAAQGELAAHIPAGGLPPPAAARLTRQLTCGLAYLHGRGLAHRDIKPENLLLDHHHTLKISDFGLATIFRHGSRERLLSRVAGTRPYCAPEVLSAPQRPYRAAPADCWGAARVLLAMLTGELYWQAPLDTDPGYMAWCSWVSGGGAPCPARLRGPPRALLRRALHPDVRRRATLQDIADYAARAEEPEERTWWSQPGAGGAAGVVTSQCASVVTSQAAACSQAEAVAEAGALPSPRAAIALSQPAAATPGDRGRCANTQWWEAPDGETETNVLPRVWVLCGARAALSLVKQEYSGASVRELPGNQLCIEVESGVLMRVSAVSCARGGVGGAGGAGGGGGGALVSARRWRGCALRVAPHYRRVEECLRGVAAGGRGGPHHDTSMDTSM